MKVETYEKERKRKNKRKSIHTKITRKYNK